MISDPPPFLLASPQRETSCTVFSSPHSGRHYPEAFVRRTRLSPLQLRISEDAHVDVLFAAVPAHGAAMIAATMPRAWLDLNRAPSELDPVLIDGVRAQGLNPRVAAGLGVVPRVVAEGVPIYAGRLSLAEAEARIAGYHDPYHAALARLIERARTRFGLAVLFDCHSMPSDALRNVAQSGGRRPEVVLGDRYGASASPWVIEATQIAFEAEGFCVARNTPFAGGYITQRYGSPTLGVHAIQIEIDRRLYLDEVRIEPSKEFPATVARLSRVISKLTRIGAADARLAAE